MNSRSLVVLLMALTGTVIGCMVAETAQRFSALSWLGYSLSFGLPEDFVIDLAVIRLRFGIDLRLSVAAAVFCTVFVILGLMIQKKH